ncbi:MAG: alkaline phosphatase family protein [Anaerolineae bacterium]
MSRVIFIMLDGLRPDALTQAHTPTLDAFMQRGASTLDARSVIPSITLPCHTSIFHSVTPARHGIVENIWHPMARPVQGLVEHLKYHDKRSGFVHNWEPLRDLNRPENLHFSFYVDNAYQLDSDEIISEMGARYATAFDFLFVYFGSIDIAGHFFGWMADEYLQQVETVDRLVAPVLEAADAETTILIHADHGGHERTHGTDLPEDMVIPWMIAGPGIKQQYVIQQPVSLLDTAPTVAHLLGVPKHRDWEGAVVQEAFL